MKFTRIKLTNWKNFVSAEVSLPERVFIIGPNASGKSNFLDAFRFLHDLAVPGGGLQRACFERGGVSKIRCLSARSIPGVTIEVELIHEDTKWEYEISFVQQNRSAGPIIQRERVVQNGEIILNRPDEEDEKDPKRRSQTALEQINVNQKFRNIADYFEQISYLHLVPQMIRGMSGFSRDYNVPTMYGGGFLENMAETSEKVRTRRLEKIGEVLRVAVPQLKGLKFGRDERGIPHLEALWEHWRPNNAGQQDESQFSDGTLRLIGLLWALQDGHGLLLLEEPELSLHTGIVRQLAPFIHRVRKKNARQVFISTHSLELLSDPGIGPEEIIMLKPDQNGTRLTLALDVSAVKNLMEAGIPASEAAIPATNPNNLGQLELFKL